MSAKEFGNEGTHWVAWMIGFICGVLFLTLLAIVMEVVAG